MVDETAVPDEAQQRRDVRTALLIFVAFMLFMAVATWYTVANGGESGGDHAPTHLPTPAGPARP